MQSVGCHVMSHFKQHYLGTVIRVLYYSHVLSVLSSTGDLVDIEIRCTAKP